MFSPEQMNMGISKSRLMVLISFLAVLLISERFSCEWEIFPPCECVHVFVCVCGGVCECRVESV